jgi:hypothetical protein
LATNTAFAVELGQVVEPLQLNVLLPLHWHKIDAPGYSGKLALRRGQTDETGVMQGSFALGVQVPNPSAAGLVEQAQNFGIKVGYGKPVETGSGTCAIGIYGMALFHPNPNRAQVWYVTNSRDIVVVSYICSQEQGADGLAEAQSVINTMTLDAA